MTATLIIDPDGRLSLPLAFLEKFHLCPGAKLLADLGEDGMALRPERFEGTEPVTLVEKDGFFVIAGTEPFDAVKAIHAARGEREDFLVSTFVK